MKKVIYLVALCAMICSCRSSVTYTSRTGRSLEMPTEMWQQWTTADLQVSEAKVKATVENQNNGVFMSEDALRQNAVGKALEQSGADILINPVYTTDYVDGRIVRVTVSGYPAKHVNFRTVSFEEQSNFLIEKEKAANAPQIVINGAEVNNNVAPQPHPAHEEAPAPTQPTTNRKK